MRIKAEGDACGSWACRGQRAVWSQLATSSEPSLPQKHPTDLRSRHWTWLLSIYVDVLVAQLEPTLANATGSLPPLIGTADPDDRYLDPPIEEPSEFRSLTFSIESKINQHRHFSVGVSGVHSI
ncbi:hypothetical protein BO94DRAFT_215907 [Aspergillus sclerotioniger CBS 115572]|uniref:Uncharacterized protein n=1 Tax=Aspergillus sclerotioniger CBS 115572 TaxID=1450535 RepID=A0A317X8S9_9EURO|nr:hypothetical protein BO94DRAFT_215907 [Aspergillus sclerotioniger CBS 115572]PWY95006.1 hypothetical protein BO94DRAFT_215907 [Aspergillus sclerotioniger CBS 115572]